MWIYLIIYAIFAVFYFSANNYRRNSNWLAISLFGLAVFVGISDMLGGYDRYIYGEVFDYIADITAKHGNYKEEGIFDMFFAGDRGYIIINILLSHITQNRYIFIFIYTCIFYILLYQSLKKYTYNYSYALLLFLGLWFFFSFTYLRQILGAVTAWMAIPFILKRKPWKYALIILTAYTIHNSALIFAPLYFLPLKKYSPKMVIQIFAGCLFVGLTNISGLLLGAYSEISDATKARVAGLGDDEGAFRFEYVLEAILFAYFILSNYKSISNSRKSILLMNMALIFCAILLLFVRSMNGGRLSWYYMIGILATFSSFPRRKATRKTSEMILLISFMLYLRIIIAWGIQLSPYKTFFTNGYRNGDLIHELYEYDSNYDKDKFYR